MNLRNAKAVNDRLCPGGEGLHAKISPLPPKFFEVSNPPEQRDCLAAPHSLVGRSGTPVNQSSFILVIIGIRWMTLRFVTAPLCFWHFVSFPHDIGEIDGLSIRNGCEAMLRPLMVCCLLFLLNITTERITVYVFCLSLIRFIESHLT